MSLNALRFRRALSLSSSIINTTNFTLSSSVSSTVIPSHSLHPTQNKRFLNPVQCRTFRSSTTSLSSRPRSAPYNSRNDDDAFDGEILFEGCDFNHWLITIDFPKDSKPTPEEMVEFYVQTAAKVVGSVEEAKKKIYACSTTTYQGFQIQVTEEMSEKFRDLPGVVFILPDSYTDPMNKEYGGDKYENGVITHRPPYVRLGRQGVKYSDRNDGNRTRGSYQQGNSRNETQRPYRNISCQQSPQSQQNYSHQQSLELQQNYAPQQGPNVRRDNIPVIKNNNNERIGQESYGKSMNQGSYQGSGQPGGTQRQGAGQLSGQGSDWYSGQGGYGRGSYGGTHGYGGVGGGKQPSGQVMGRDPLMRLVELRGGGGYEQGSCHGGVGSYGQGTIMKGRSILVREGKGKDYVDTETSQAGVMKQKSV